MPKCEAEGCEIDVTFNGFTPEHHLCYNHRKELEEKKSITKKKEKAKPAPKQTKPGKDKRK